MQINKVCVIGAGVMGAGIAALIANARIDVLLLDIAIDDSVKDRMLSGKMPQLAHPSLTRFIEIGKIDESLEKIKTCDWVIEVIVEKSEIKGDLYKKISPYIKSEAVISSNTSTLPMKELRDYFPSILQRNFLLTHFFNPPRYMQLLEIIYDEKTSDLAVNEISEFIAQHLGKIIVKSNDTPGFIANRVGCFLLELCLKEAYEKKLPIPVIDYVFTKYLGFPSTGIFGLIDLIGLDVTQMISEVLIRALPQEDKFCITYKKYDFYDKMIAQGYKGRKGLGGFYKLSGKIKEVLNFSDMNYIESNKIELPKEESIKDFLKTNQYAENLELIITEFFTYVNSLLGEVSSSKADIDLAMKLGYSWKYGPFEMENLIENNSHSSLQGVSQIRGGNPSVWLDSHSPAMILENSSAFLYEAKPGNFVLSFKTKMNILNHEIFNMIIASVDYVEKNNAKKLIIYSEGRHFSAGADLKLFLEMAEACDVEAADFLLKLGQEANKYIKYSKVPVIACAKGVALGGGCELLLHSHHVISHLDLIAGLVEVGVGLIPGWGGLKEMVLRATDDKILERNLKNIILQNKTSSAYYFIDDFSINNAHIVMNENQLLEYALDNDFKVAPSSSNELKFKPNCDLLSDLGSNDLDEYTIFIAKELQEMINSANLSEEKLFEIERVIFKKLLIAQKTKDKIKLVVGK